MARWVKGQSGNPEGGSRKLAQARRLLEYHSPELMKKAIDEALDGDNETLRFLVGRLLPVQGKLKVNGKVDHDHRALPELRYLARGSHCANGPVRCIGNAV